MPQYTAMTTCNSDLNESKLIREAEEMEKLLIPPRNSLSTSQKESDCIICNTSALVDTSMICSLCSKNVHYIFNNPNVSAYPLILGSESEIMFLT